MAAVAPKSGSSRSNLLTEAATRGVVRSSFGLRTTSSPTNYVEDDTESDASGNINVGSSSLLENVDSENVDSDISDDGDKIRCKCKHNVDDPDRAYVCCDGCGYWSHMECYGLDEDEKEEDVSSKEFLCQYCKDRSEEGDVVELSDKVNLPLRETTSNPRPADGTKGGRKTFDVSSYYPSSRDLSVQKPNKRVSFDAFAKSPSPEGDGDEDGYRPLSDEASSEMDEEEDNRNAFDDDEDENSLFVRQPHRERSRYQQSPTPTRAPVPTQWDDGVEDFEVAKTPRAPGVTDLGEGIVRTWISGGYAAEIDASLRDDGSDTSSIDIPDMSEGANLLQKLAEQDRLIFTLKNKVEKRGDRIAKLKREVQALGSENEMLMQGGNVMGM